MADIKKVTSECAEAVKKFAADRNKDNMVQLMTVLEKGIVFVPVITDARLTEEQMEEVKKSGQFALPKGTKIQNHLLKAGDGSLIFPIFTTVEEITNQEMKRQVMMIPFYECAKVVVNSNGKIKAAVMNPFTDNVGIVEALLKACVERREAVLKAKKEAQEKGGPREIKVTEKQFHAITRNQIELQLVPKKFFTGKQEYLGQLALEKGDYFYQLYQKSYGEQLACPYGEDEFSVMCLNLKENFELVSIDLPSKKLQNTMCYKLYMTWDQEKDEFRYFVMQKQKEGKFFIEIREDGSSAKISEAPPEGGELGAVMEYLDLN